MNKRTLTARWRDRALAPKKVRLVPLPRRWD
jgi:hypothetical protein